MSDINKVWWQSFTAPLSYSLDTQAIFINQAGSATDGYLSSIDWTSFNQKLGQINYTPVTPTRVLNSGFIPNASYATFVSYTISISCSLSLSGGQVGSVSLLSDSSTTPTTLRSRVSNTNSGTLTLGLALVNAQESVLSYIVPPGHKVLLTSSGTATISITAQSEVTLTPS